MGRFSPPMLALALIAVFGAPSRAQAPDRPARRAASARIQPGDHVMLRIFQEAELTGEINVNERGDASFPKLGVINVSSLTIAEIQDTLVARYSQYLRNPAIEVTILRRIAVQGAVQQPNVYMVDVSTTVSDVIARAGGITEVGNPRKVYLERSGQRTLIAHWETERGVLADIQSGDRVIVGRRSWLSLNLLPAISTSVVVFSIVYGMVNR